MTGLGANFEYDLKKIIDLSTLRQLGLMIWLTNKNKHTEPHLLLTTM